MSLDKFVSRGYTSSLGESSGKWVAQDSRAATPPATSHYPNHESGTTFVLGATSANPGRAYGEKSKPFEYRESDYTFNRDDIRHEGTRSHRNAPSGCFGSSNGNASGGTIDGHKAVVGLFMAAIVVGIAVIATGGWSQDTPKAGEYRTPIERYTGAPRQPLPVWDR